MFLTFLFVTFSQQLTFKHLTLPILWQWYCNHPFCFLFALSEMLSWAILIMLSIGLQLFIAMSDNSLKDDEELSSYHDDFIEGSYGG